MYIDLPRFDLPVVFGEIEYTLPSLPALVTSNAGPGQPTTGPAVAPSSIATILSRPDSGLFSIIDPEIARDNIVEAKHLRLVRSHRSGPLDREMKPNAVTRDQLNAILDYPPTQALTSAEANLLWQFRFYLTRDKRGLTKLLKSIKWSDRDEVKQAVETLLPMWAEIEIGDALELLGPGEAFRDRRVRSYAVKQIARADDEAGLSKACERRKADMTYRNWLCTSCSWCRPSSSNRRLRTLLHRLHREVQLPRVLRKLARTAQRIYQLSKTSSSVALCRIRSSETTSIGTSWSSWRTRPSERCTAV